MKQKNQSQNKGNEILNQFLEQNKENLDAIAKYSIEIRREYLETKAAEGTLTAVLCAYKTIDTLLSEGLAKNPEQQISCYNCTAAYCCHQSVEISEAEASVIAQYCKENNIIIPRKYLQKQLAHNRNEIAFVGCSACVFLKNNRCSVYPVRPASCRTHYVVTPIELCDTKKHKHERIPFLSVTAAEIVKVVMISEGGKVDRMPRLLLKYSR